MINARLPTFKRYDVELHRGVVRDLACAWALLCLTFLKTWRLHFLFPFFQSGLTTFCYAVPQHAVILSFLFLPFPTGFFPVLSVGFHYSIAADSAADCSSFSAFSQSILAAQNQHIQ